MNLTNKEKVKLEKAKFTRIELTSDDEVAFGQCSTGTQRGSDKNVEPLTSSDVFGSTQLS